jgi:hypothetical protein
MARWRRRALDDFPELRRDLSSSGYSIYWLFFELLSMARKALREGDDDTLRRIFEYAEWCLMQRRNKEPSNAAAVAFYEHIFDQKDRATWPATVDYLSPDVIRNVAMLWTLFCDELELVEIKQLIIERHGPDCVVHMPTEPYLKDRPPKAR